MFLREVWPQRLTSWVSTCLSKSHPSPNLDSNCCVPGRVNPHTLPIPSRSQVWSLVTQPEREVQVGSGASEGSSTHLGPAPINTCRPSPISHIFLWNLWKNGCSVNSSQSKQSKLMSKTQFPNLHSVSARTKCSLYGRDIQSFQGSWCRCDHRSFQRNTRLYLNSQKKHWEVRINLNWIAAISHPAATSCSW